MIQNKLSARSDRGRVMVESLFSRFSWLIVSSPKRGRWAHLEDTFPRSSVLIHSVVVPLEDCTARRLLEATESVLEELDLMSASTSLIP